MAKLKIIDQIKEAATPELLDRAIGFFLPEVEKKRLAARLSTRQMRSTLEWIETRRKRAFEAATKGRRLSGWTAGTGSINAQLAGSLDTLRNRSRDLVQNNAIARRAIDVLEAYIVGSGIVPQINPLAGKRVTNTLNKAWLDWAETPACDFDGALSFYGLQGLMVRQQKEGGEALIVRRRMRTSDNLPLPIQLQMLEPEYLDTSKDQIKTASGGKIVQGVEFDSRGKRVAYWLFESHPGEALFNSMKSVRIPADDVIHLRQVYRPGQVRGIPELAAVILRLRDLDEYEDAQLVKQKVAACFTATVIRSEGFRDIDGNEEATEPDDGFELLEPGLIQHLRPGESIEFGTPPPVEGFGDFSAVTVHRIATGIGVPYSALSGDLTKVNFSSARVGRMDFKRIISKYQQNTMNPQVNARVWQWFLEACETQGLVSGSAPASWKTPAFEMIDPLKEMQARQLELELGLRSKTEMILEDGREPSEVFEQRKKDQETEKEMGIATVAKTKSNLTSGKELESTDEED